MGFNGTTGAKGSKVHAYVRIVLSSKIFRVNKELKAFLAPWVLMELK